MQTFFEEDRPYIMYFHRCIHQNYQAFSKDLAKLDLTVLLFGARLTYNFKKWRIKILIVGRFFQIVLVTLDYISLLSRLNLDRKIKYPENGIERAITGRRGHPFGLM